MKNEDLNFEEMSLEEMAEIEAEKRGDKKSTFIIRMLQITTVLLTVAFVGLLIWSYFDEKKQEEELWQRYEESEPLQKKQKELRLALAELEREYQVKINGRGTLTLLFMDMTEDIYNVMYPLLNEHGFDGLLAVSETEFPGKEGCMSIEQAEELMQQGWQLCLHYNGETVLEEWLSVMETELSRWGRSVPTLICFDWNTYQEEMDVLLAEYGIEAVIRHQDNKRPLLTTQTGEGIWHIGVWGWNQVSARTTLETAVENGASLVFSVGGTYYYDEDQFPKMLKVLAEFEETDSLFVTDVTAAFGYRSQTEEEREAYKAELEAARAELQVQMDEVDRQMREIYKEMN